MSEESCVLVVGGGVAGLTVATALADRGLSTVLVERSTELGGHAAGWACMATDECARCSACMIEDAIRKALDHPGLRIFTNAGLDGVTGRAGAYEVSLSPFGTGAIACGRRAALVLGSPHKIDARCIVLATGFDVYDPSVEPLLGYGRLSGVLTLKDMDAALRRDELDSVLPESGDALRLGFIQCVGSRDRVNGRGYCSQFCCRASIRMLNRLLYLRPELQAVVFYIDLQLMSKEFRVFYERAKERVQFVQGVPAEVYASGKDSTLKVYGSAPGEDKARAFEFDRIVLATGISPASSRQQLRDLFGMDEDSFGFLSVPDEEKGIFAAGACAGPTDMQGSMRMAMATASRVASWLGSKEGVSHVDAR